MRFVIHNSVFIIKFQFVLHSEHLEEAYCCTINMSELNLIIKSEL